MWLDDYYSDVFLETQPAIKHLNLGNDLTERVVFRHKYNCMNFRWWLQTFHDVFEKHGLIVETHHHIRHVRSGLCLESWEPTVDRSGVHPATPVSHI